MSSVMQINPFDFFVDADGDALDDGNVYIGEIYKYSPSFPVTVYYDELLTIPAPNPLKTSNGYIVRNGTPTFLYINGNYSVLVTDKNGQQVYYVPNFLLTGSGGSVSAGDLGSTDPTKGASLVGWSRARLKNQMDTVAEVLNGRSVSVWEFANLAGGYTPTGDPATWNWQPAIQAALNSLVTGYELYFPGGYTYNVINATGNGANIVAQRANAVSSNTLFALTCSTPGIRIRIDGVVKGSSALDDLFRLSGAKVMFDGQGTLQGPGVFLDTNSTDPLLQWYPSLVNLTGADSGAVGLNFLDAPTVGLRLLANRGFAFRNEFVGGPLSHGTGTVMFGVYAGTPVGGTSGCMVIENNFIKSAAGGANYSGVFSVCASTWICNNNFDGMYEHGVYNYGSKSMILANMVNGTTIAGGIQVFAQDCVIGWNEVSNCTGGIALENPDRCKILYNQLTIGIQLSGISVRTYIGTDPNAAVTDLDIIGNNVTLSSNKQSNIDILLDHSLINVNIIGNICAGAPVPGASGRLAAITVRVFDPVPSPGIGLKITDNTIHNCDGYAITVGRIFNFKVTDNSITNVTDQGTVAFAIAVFSSSQGEVSRNTVNDTRTIKLTPQILSASSADLNASVMAYDNNGITLLTSTNPICVLPSDSIARRNTLGSLPYFGLFTASNTTTQTVNSGVSAGAGAIRPGATVLLEPIGKIAVDQQAGAARLYVSGVGAGFFTVATSNAGLPGVNGAFKWEVIQ